MKKVIIITGPTAVGKTSISIALAKYYNGEIINADASQMRKHLDIGTAKIKIDEMNGVKHHLIDFLNPLESFSIKDFQDVGRKLIDEIDLPFIVGGSGLYIQSLISDYNLDTSPRKTNHYDFLNNDELYDLLLKKDYETAQKLHPNNRRRVIRYLEIIAERGKVATNPPIPIYDALIICLSVDRKKLYENINARCELMIANGWIDECISLQKQGIDLQQIKEIGYKDIGLYLDGKLEYLDLVDKIKQKQRNYAKRQLTWFKNKMNCVFVDNDNNVEMAIIDLINNHLRSK